jgi:hypothetical protein
MPYESDEDTPELQWLEDGVGLLLEAAGQLLGLLWQLLWYPFQRNE